MDTISNNDESRTEVSPEIARQVRAALADLLLTGTTPVPPVLENLPIEIWLEKIVPTSVAADLLSVTPETILTNPEYRSKLIQIDGRKFGMRLRDALKLPPRGGAKGGRGRRPVLQLK